MGTDIGNLDIIRLYSRFQKDNLIGTPEVQQKLSVWLLPKQFRPVFFRKCPAKFCSHLALLPSKSSNGHPLIARNYEFNDELEDFQLIKTSVEGKYTHMGTSVLSFGREIGRAHV